MHMRKHHLQLGAAGSQEQEQTGEKRGCSGGLDILGTKSQITGLSGYLEIFRFYVEGKDLVSLDGLEIYNVAVQ